MDGRTQTGLVGCCHYEEYYSGKIKKHELTRTAKEDDRVNHVDALNANAEPVFFFTGQKVQLIQLLKVLLRTNLSMILLLKTVLGMNCGSFVMNQ